MLTKRQNLMETIKGGNPDRFVKQYEFMHMIVEAAFTLGALAELKPGTTVKDAWGVTWTFIEGQVSGFPVHDEEHVLIKDVSKWRDYVKKPEIPTDDASWAPAIAHAEAVDRNEEFVTAMMAPGVFEMTHHMMSMENALMALYEEPEAMHELIDYITEFEMEFARLLVDKIKPDALFHHDDWGSSISSFVAPEMFDEFFLPAYKKIYGFYKDNGVEVIVHHSDSYAANLIPQMIDMGIDIWQGCITANNVPELVKQYGSQITFMGDLDSGAIDFPEWKPEICAEHVERACRNNGKLYFIPCLTMGGPDSLFPGVYEQVNQEIDKMSKVMFEEQVTAKL